MKKNQKYTQEEMYLAIELRNESGLSQREYCRQNGITYNTFKYWVKKYNGKKKPVKPTGENLFSYTGKHISRSSALCIIIFQIKLYFTTLQQIMR